MGKPLMLKDSDAERLEALKQRLKATTKIEVVRRALRLLENEAERVERVARWQRAAPLVARESRQVNREFRTHTRLRRLD